MSADEVKATPAPEVSEGLQATVMKMVEEKKTQFVAKIDEYAEMEQIKTIADKANQEPKTVAMGIAGAAVFFGVMTVVLMVGMKTLLELALYIPAVMKSIKAIESPEKDDDTDLLSFWVVYCFFTICDPFVQMVFFWVPYFGLFKFAFLQYCYRFKGTLFITETILKPVYNKITAMMEKAAPAAPAEAPEKAD
uniref:Receptor expression-enhancing protein n=1 Tax=Florenciella parvula TaxID=236787 RepID=A0A7S2CLN4_9STRA